jgi:hypothetical protein
MLFLGRGGFIDMDGWTICPVFFSPLVELVLYSPSKALPQLCPIASSICFTCIFSQKLRLTLSAGMHFMHHAQSGIPNNNKPTIFNLFVRHNKCKPIASCCLHPIALSME